MHPPHPLKKLTLLGLAGALCTLSLSPLSSNADEVLGEPVVNVPVTASDPTAVGTVVAIQGEVMAQRPGEEPRPLECRDSVYQDERVVTHDGAHVDLMMGDVLAHLPQKSKLRVGRTDDNMADMLLEEGAVRAIDPRDAGAQARLAALDTGGQVVGNDAEAYIFAEKTGRYAVLCEWDAPLPVDRRDESKVAEPGQCVIAKPKEPLYVADAHDERLGPPGDNCPLGPMNVGMHLTPDVAAPPPAWSGLASNPNALSISPCQVPGSGCQGAVVVVPPPVGGPFPGAGGT
jgi:hypothetical protein